MLDELVYEINDFCFVDCIKHFRFEVFDDLYPFFCLLVPGKHLNQLDLILKTKYIFGFVGQIVKRIIPILGDVLPSLLELRLGGFEVLLLRHQI